MKVATILPQPYLDMVEDDDYHLCLAHLIGVPEYGAYTEFFERKANGENNYVILDNGLIEGDPRPISELRAKAICLGAQELILPDVFMNKEATLKAVRDALVYMQAFGKYSKALRIMAVPQGATLEEWLACARAILQMDGIDTIGIPKVLAHIHTQEGRLEALLELGTELDGYDIHLLGCWHNPIELTQLAAAEQDGLINKIRGVDSAIAYVYSRSNLRIAEAVRPVGAVNFNAEDADRELLQLNINTWKASSQIVDEESNVTQLL